MEPQIQYVTTSDGVNIAYYAIGSGPLQINVTIPNSHLQLERQTPEIRAMFERVARARTLVRYDARGLGLSDRDVTDFSLEAMVRDLEAVAGRLGTEPLRLVAFDASAPVVIAYAVKHAERVDRIVLQTAFSRGAEYNSPQLDAMAALAETDWELASEAINRVFGGWAEEKQAASRRMAALLRECLSAQTYASLHRQRVEWDVSGLLPRLTAPTLIVRPRQQRLPSIETVRKTAATIPGARLVMAEDWAEVGRAMDAFLQEGDAPPEAAPELPHGTAIILFTDIVDSTALTEQLGDAAFRERAGTLDAALRSVIAEAGGMAVEGKVLGDGVMAVFNAARDAIACAARCHAAAAGTGLQLHLGIHAGDVMRDGNTVYGGAVNIASRVCTVSAPGETLVSDVVRVLARTSAGVVFDDRGEHQMKGVGEAVRLFAVRESG